MKCRLPDEYRAQGKASVNLSMYDLNKQIISQLSPIGANPEAKEAYDKDFKVFDNNTKNTYYMLLCKELSSYSLFKHTGRECDDGFKEVVEEILSNYGEWITYSWANEEIKNAIEYWVKIKEPTEEDENHEEIYCFILFGYDAGLVEVK